MTRCNECGIAARSESPVPARAESFRLDADSERAIRAELKVGARGRIRVLQVVHGEAREARLQSDPALDVTTVVVRDDDSFEAHARVFDAAFVNGSAEFVRDPPALIRRVRALLAPGGSLVVVTASDLPRQDERALPRFLYAPIQLIRLAMTAGFKPQSCGLLARSPATPVADDRFAGELRFAQVYRLLSWLGQQTEAPTGLLALRATAEPLPPKAKLSIIMPVFNEAATFRATFDRVVASRVDEVTREIVIVESNSTDGTKELVKAIEGTPDVRVIYEDKPRGKGHAVRAGIAAATGDFILIQDADSEYDVADYDIVLEPLLQLRSTFVLGSRHLGGRTWKIRQFGDYKHLAVLMNLAHEGFTLLANVLYDSDMRDPTTMYKVFRRECYAGIDFKRDRFDFDWELVCKLIRRGHVPIEVPINYKSRSYSEGKKVGLFRDPITWLTTIVSSRFEALGHDR
jgi:hypothetical protein